MKRFVTLALVGALVLGASSFVYANVCAFDAVPAATLLFPFVTLDYNAPADGVSTTFSITNVSAEAQIVHVTVWSDFSSAVLDFNILLTGYDVIAMNIRDILITGQLPVTVWEAHSADPEVEGVFPNGPVSPSNVAHQATWLTGLMDDPQATNALGDRCSPTGPNGGTYPGLYTTKIPAGYLGLFQGYLQASQTADKVYSDDCYQSYGDTYDVAPTPYWVARDTTYPTNMYITADVVTNCNKLFPDALTYWQDEARTDNVLIGDVLYTSTAENLSEALNAVHLEADVDLANVATIDPDSGAPISLFHRYTSRVNPLVSDYREPLPTAWAFRYLGAGMSTIGTDIRVWKGSTDYALTYDLERVGSVPSQPDTLVASNCHAYTYYAWDEDEIVTSVTTIPWSGGADAVIPNLLPLETQTVPVDQFDTPGAFGWMLFVWPASNYPANPASTDFDDYYQTWMSVRYNAYGLWSAALDGAVMANFNCFSDQILPNIGINYSYVDANGYVTSPPIAVPTN